MTERSMTPSIHSQDGRLARDRRCVFPCGYGIGLTGWTVVATTGVKGVILGVLMVLALCMGGTLAAATATAQLDRPSVDVGGSVGLRITISPMISGAEKPPDLPQINNCQVRYAGAGSQVTFINGVRTDSVQHIFTVVPEKQGVVNIPSIEVVVGGETLRTAPLTLQVTKGLSSEDFGFVELLGPTNTVYVGQVFPVRLRFLFRASPKHVDLPVLPTDGFVVGRRPKLVSGQERVNGEVYGVVTSDIALTPARAGTLTLGPAEWGAVFPVGSRGGRSLFDEPIFQRFFGEDRQFLFKSPEYSVRVIDPPRAGRPAGYLGAVGRFQMTAGATPTQVKVGDPITVRIRVQGMGSIERLRLPEPPPTDMFNFYAGTNRFDPSDVLGMSGIKTFEYIYVPRRTNLTELILPPLPFFDPEARTYDTASVRPIPIRVLPSEGGAPLPESVPGVAVSPPTEENGSIRQPAQIHPGPPVYIERLQPWAMSPAFIGSTGGAFLVLALVWGGLAIKRNRRKDEGKQLRQEAEERLANALLLLQAAAQVDNSGAFCKHLRTVLQEQVGMTLERPAEAVTADCVSSALVPAGLSERAAGDLTRLFEMADAAWYGTEALEIDCGAEFARLEEVLEALRHMRDGGEA